MRHLPITAAFAVGLAALMISCSVVSSFDGLACGANCNLSDGALDVAKGSSDGSTPTDDGSVVPGSDGASVDAGTSQPDTGTLLIDAGTPGLKYTCAGNMGARPDCTKCPGAPVPCVLCGNNGSNHADVVGVCATNATSSACEGKGPAGYDDCLCTNSPSICAQPFNICVQQSGPACRTCGWDGGVGLPCQGGGTCNVTNQCL